MSGPTLAHKIRLRPNREQEKYFLRACGVSRFTWNWALETWKKGYEKGEKPNALELKKQFNAIKSEEFPWTYEVTKYASQQPFIHLQSAFQRFFQKKSQYPRFKKRGLNDSFYVGDDHLKLEGKPLKKNSRNSHVNCRVRRRTRKIEIRRERLYLRIRNSRQDALHKLTTRITKSFDSIAIVKGIVRNRRLARAILDMGFYEFRRQLVYKSRLRGCHVFDVDRWFPSSKMCSRCHVIKDSLPLGERMFRCDACGFVIDRDINAARNNAWISFDPFSTVSSTNLRDFKPGERKALAHAYA